MHSSSDDKYDGEDYIETITADSESVDKNSINQQIVCINSDGSEYPHQIEVDEYNEEQLEEEALDSTQYERITVNSSNKKSENNSVYYISAPGSHSSITNESQLQSPPRQSKMLTQAQAQSIATHNDPDERFLLSCLPILKRLPNKKNALARLRIQQLLFEIEFDEYTEVGGQ